jgi:serine/threonine-protein kinase
VLQTTRLFIDSLGMPGWAMPAAAILLLIGLVVILATAWVQSHPLTPHREAVGEVPSGGALDLGGIRDDITQGRLPHLTWGRAVAGGVFAFALLFGIAGLYVVIQDRGRSFAPAEAVAESQAAPGIAVLPFSVRGQEMDVWREGLVDLLSTGLDGAAGLRAIDSRTVLARWGEAVADSANTDLATGLEVARRTGARYALVGSAVATGADLRLVADIYRLEDGRSMGQARAEGSADSVLAIADGLAVEVLKVILQKETDLPRIDLARVTTASFPALKAYLEGEVLFRGGDFDAAIEAYERAVAADSTFALAYYRLGIAYGWDESLGSESSVRATDRAARLADRLPEREAVLVRALRAESQQELDGLEPLRQAVQRYPDDAEAWFLLGDVYFHLGDQALVDVAESEPPFRRAVELQPRFAPYRIHLLHLAFTLHGDSAMAARELAEYSRLAPGTVFDRAARAAFPLAFGDRTTRAHGRAALDTLDVSLLRTIRNGFLPHPRYWEEMDAISAAIIARSNNPGAQAGERIGRARRAAFWKGRWRALVDVLNETQAPGRACQLHELHLRGFPVDPATLDAALALGAGDTTLAQGAFCKALYAAETGRGADHARVLGIARREVENALAKGDSLAASRERTGVQGLEGYALWQRGEREEALPLLREVQTKVGGPVNPIVAKLLLEMGRPDEAEPYLRAMGHDPLAHYQLAKIYEEREDRDAAREAYEYFATHWSDADPEMQPLVADARQAAIRLRGLQRE